MYDPLPPLGQDDMAGSLPVVLASNQSAIPVTGTFWQATQPVSGTFWQATQPVSGTLTAVTTVSTVTAVTAITNALPAGTNNIGDVDVLTLPAVHFQDLFITGQGSQTALNNNIVLATAGTGSTDLLNGTTGASFRSVSIEMIPAAGTVTAGVVTFEGSNDNTNFVPVFLSDKANVTAVPVSTVTIAASTNRFFAGAVPWRYFRARISTGLTGTTTGLQAHTVFSMSPYSEARYAVTNATAASLLAQVNVASGGIASGAIASGAIASGAIASGAIAAGAVAAGATSIAENEDVARAAADRLLKVAQVRVDAPPANANVSGTEDYTQFIADNWGKTWMAGSVTEDVAHAAGESLMGMGARRINTLATSTGSDADWGTANQTAEGGMWSTLAPTTTSGVSIFRSIDIDESEEEVKATAGNVYGYYFGNTTASARYLKFYNATAATVVVGTTAPVITMYLPPTSAGHVTFPYPITFSTAICVAATTGVADADTGAPGASDVLVMVYYL